MIAIAPTDLDWFETLREELVPSEINFWTPTPWNVGRLEQGDRFYFLLKAPYRQIGGYGHFSYYENMSARQAWDRFGKGNGVDDFGELVARASKYANRRSFTFSPSYNPVIGCIVLNEPVFLDENEFIKPEDYGFPVPRQVVKFKYFDVDSIGHTEPWARDYTEFQLVEDEHSVYRAGQSKIREGQAAFRRRVLTVYGNKCCITGERSPEVLDAAHIQPYVNRDSNHIQNGLPFRVDFHKLFDAGLITLDDDYRVIISDHLDSEPYRIYNGQEIRLPNVPLRPSRQALESHRELVFRP